MNKPPFVSHTTKRDTPAAKRTTIPAAPIVDDDSPTVVIPRHWFETHDALYAKGNGRELVVPSESAQERILGWDRNVRGV